HRRKPGRRGYNGGERPAATLAGLVARRRPGRAWRRLPFHRPCSLVFGGDDRWTRLHRAGRGDLWSVEPMGDRGDGTDFRSGARAQLLVPGVEPASTLPAISRT